MGTDPKAFMKLLDAMFVGAYQIMGRLEDVPLTTEFDVAVIKPSTECSRLCRIPS